MKIGYVVFHSPRLCCCYLLTSQFAWKGYKENQRSKASRPSMGRFKSAQFYRYDRCQKDGHVDVMYGRQGLGGGEQDKTDG